MFRALRPVLLLLLVAIPAVALRVTGTHPPALASILIFGLAVVAASFVLAWAAEAAEMDISGGLAIALLAVIAVLPEYASTCTSRTPPARTRSTCSTPPPT